MPGGWRVTVNIGSSLRAWWSGRVQLICFQVMRRCRLSSFYSLPLHSSVLKPHFHLWIKMISNALKLSGDDSANESRAIPSDSKEFWSQQIKRFATLFLTAKLGGPHACDPCASHSAFSTETQEHGPSVPTLFLHAPSRQNLSATHFESKGWQAAKICRMHRKM